MRKLLTLCLATAVGPLFAGCGGGVGPHAAMPSTVNTGSAQGATRTTLATNKSTASPDIGIFMQKIPSTTSCTGGGYTADGGNSITCNVPFHGSTTLLFGVVFLKGAPGSFSALSGCDTTCQATGQPASTPLSPLGVNVPYVFIAPSSDSSYTGLTTPSICEPNLAFNPNFPTVPKTSNCINFARGNGKLTGLQFSYNGRAAKGSTEVITFQQSTETPVCDPGPDCNAASSGPVVSATYTPASFYAETITVHFVEPAAVRPF